jgi:hypothetical protein
MKLIKSYYFIDIMSSSVDAYENAEAEFERILAESLYDCILPKQDIKDILMTKSVQLYIENLLKRIVIQVSAYDKEIKCISCYTESNNVLNICKCGLENLCYSCFLIKYINCLTSAVKENKQTAIVNNIFCEKGMLEILRNTIKCKYCNTPGCFHIVLDNMNCRNMQQKTMHVLTETDFLPMKTKTLIDIFPISKMSAFVHKKKMESLAQYGFDLKYYNKSNEEHIIEFNLNPELIETIVAELKHIPSVLNIDSIKCDCKIITPAVFNAIYYKCIDFGLKNKDIKRDLLFRWNKHCQKLNGLLDTYAKNVDKTMNYYITTVLINEINTIS